MLPNDLRVLVVDDNQSDRLICKTILSQMQIKTLHGAENGSIAEAKMLTAVEAGEPYHLVVLDWNMPRVGGLKLLQYLRQNARFKNVKIMIMTASADRSVVDQAIENGVDDFVVKPLQTAPVQAKVKRIIDSLAS